MTREVKIIEAASENGAGRRGSSLGPSAVFLQAREQNLRFFEKRDWQMVEHFNDDITPGYRNPFAKNIESVVKSQENLCSAVENCLSDGYFPLILSGDHSNAIGGVSGVKNHYSDEKLGVIWIDAHMDLHSPYTTPSGNLHGMALNALLDLDNIESKRNDVSKGSLELWERLKKLGSHEISPKVMPQHVVFLGPRDFEKEEKHLVEKNGILHYGPAQIRELGIEEVLAETLKKLEACDVLYISFDVDCLDTSISHGTGTPVDGGLKMTQAEYLVNALFHHPKVKAFEITEINPLLDVENLMAKCVVKLLDNVL